MLGPKNSKAYKMRKPKIKMTVIREDDGYSATSTYKNIFIGTQGDDLDQLRQHIVEAVNLAFEPKGFTYTLEEIGIKPDLQSFFDFYKVINPRLDLTVPKY